MQDTFLILEPIGKDYRIVTAEDNSIILSTKIPVELMEEIKDNLEKHIKKLVYNAYKEGYAQGWEDSAKDDFDK